MHRHIGIVGGGPGGLLLACLLQRQGMRVTVLERDAYAAERLQGGSLDLHDETGQRAMRAAGLEDAFMACARHEDQGDRLYDETGRLIFEHDGRDANRPEIDRGDLRRILLESLEPGVVHWGQCVNGIVSAGEKISVLCTDGPQLYDVVIGADGAWSRVRPFLTKIQPVYEGIVFLELGFEEKRDPRAAALVGHGKMFAVGNNRALILQRNSGGHIRFYAGMRLAEKAALAMRDGSPEAARAHMARSFSSWSPDLRRLLAEGDFLGIRPLYAMPIGARWTPAPAVTLLGDAAHLMSPFSGEGVNLALADALDLANTLTEGNGVASLREYEAALISRAERAAARAASGLSKVFSDHGAAPVLAHYQQRLGGR
ncbi:FAD-dependent monooxygenase [Asaia sp. VD9]|uniref:FAD-dependent oxidoreductase n=1 Tax=Asaia sp. VD9 TaxID=3081235 RepID=UPI0030175D7D